MEKNQVVNDGGTPLLIASHQGHAEVLSTFATLALRRNKQKIMIAFQQNHAEVVQLLCNAGEEKNQAPIAPANLPCQLVQHWQRS